MDYSSPGSSDHGMFQARILEWVAISLSRGSSRPRDWTQVSCIAGRLFTDWATREDHEHEFEQTLGNSEGQGSLARCSPWDHKESDMTEWLNNSNWWHGFDPWIGKISWNRKWQPAPIFLPGLSHGQRSLAGCNPWGRKELDTPERLSTHVHFHSGYLSF